jgi:cytochrome c peroxidase
MQTICQQYRTVYFPGSIVLLFLFMLRLITGCGPHSEKRISIKATDNNTSAILTLGRYLFYDNNLSFNQTKSCASCHDPSLAFTDGYRKSSTATGDNTLHNAPSLVNAVHQLRLDWANPSITSIYQQNDRPLFNEHPVELGVKHHEAIILQRFQENHLYTSLFAKVYQNDSTITFIRIRESLAAFVASIESRQSAYDKYIRGDSTQLSAAAKHGLQLFLSTSLNCASCHTPPLFTLNDRRRPLPIDSIYVNIGLHAYNKQKIPNEDQQGVFLHTHQLGDMGKFKIPSLRNVAITAPYMHDGSMANLTDVIDLYQKGRVDHSLKDKRIKGFKLSATEKQDLIAFLHSLTDSSLLRNPSFTNPHTY